MIRIEDISENNIEDVFKICSLNRFFAPFDGTIQREGKRQKKQWLNNMLKQYGPCTKIAYYKDRPTAQILFYPEEAMPFIQTPRKDVIHLKCIFNPFPDSQQKGVGKALIMNLIQECYNGLSCLKGEKCSFIVTEIFTHEGNLPFDKFYSKYGFKQGFKEMYLEISGAYTPRVIPPYRPVSDDRGKIILSYVPCCEWGYFYAVTAKDLLKGIYPNTPIKMINVWERPNGFKKRPHLKLIAGSTIANAEVVNDSRFWIDKKDYLQNVKTAMEK